MVFNSSSKFPTFPKIYGNFVCSMIRYWHHVKFATAGRIPIWALHQNGRNVRRKVHYFANWYSIENLLYLYRSCLLKWMENLSWALSKHHLYKWRRFLWKKITKCCTTKCCTSSYICLPNRFPSTSQTLRDVSNKISPSKIAIDSSCNDVCRGTFLAKC